MRMGMPERRQKKWPTREGVSSRPGSQAGMCVCCYSRVNPVFRSARVGGVHPGGGHWFSGQSRPPASPLLITAQMTTSAAMPMHMPKSKIAISHLHVWVGMGSTPRGQPHTCGYIRVPSSRAFPLSRLGTCVPVACRRSIVPRGGQPHVAVYGWA